MATATNLSRIRSRQVSSTLGASGRIIRPLSRTVMPYYPKYTTTVIGAYSVPRWYEPLDRLVTLGQFVPAHMSGAQFRVMQAAVPEQETAGIDVITGGGGPTTGTRRPMPCSTTSGRKYPRSRASP